MIQEKITCPDEEYFKFKGWEKFSPSTDLLHKFKKACRVFSTTFLGTDREKIKAMLYEIKRVSSNYGNEQARQQDIQELLSMTNDQISANYFSESLRPVLSLENIQELSEEQFLYTSESITFFKKGSCVQVIIARVPDTGNQFWVEFALTENDPLVTFLLPVHTSNNK